MDGTSNSPNRPVLTMKAPVVMHHVEEMLTMTTLQKINKPVELIDWLGLTRAKSRVATTIMVSSAPYILRRPNASASRPNTIWPKIMPALAEAFKACETGVGSMPLFPPKP